MTETTNGIPMVLCVTSQESNLKTWQKYLDKISRSHSVSHFCQCAKYNVKEINIHEQETLEFVSCTYRRSF